MELLRRMSTRGDQYDEELVKQLSQQRRKSSFAMTAREDDPVLPSAIKPPIEVFPGSTSTGQETLLISPDPTARGFVITYAQTGHHFLTAATPSTSLPGPSHTKVFYATLNLPRTDSKRRDSDRSDEDKLVSKRMCTLTRDSVSFRRRHHVDDPYNGRRLLDMEFSTSSWNMNELKANIELLNKYSKAETMEPVKLRWRGRRASLEGVLETSTGKPVAVCARGEGTEEGEYVLYVAPGMDMYACTIIVMAVDDRIRRGSDDNSRPNGLGGRRQSDVFV